MNPSVAYSTSARGGIQNVTTLYSASTGQNNTLIVARRARLYGVFGQANGTYTIYVKVFDKASNPTPGVDTPLLTIPFSSAQVWNGTALVANPTPFFYDFGDIGIEFDTGMGFSLLTGASPASNTGVTNAGDITGLTFLWQ